MSSMSHWQVQRGGVKNARDGLLGYRTVDTGAGTASGKRALCSAAAVLRIRHSIQAAMCRCRCFPDDVVVHE
jgi:hypothetical protein